MSARAKAGANALDKEKAPYAKIEALCPHYGRCGGCSLQDLAYTDQLLFKEARVRRALASVGVQTTESIQPLADPWRYRNKAELTFSTVDDHLVLGYHAAGSFSRVVDIDRCLLMPDAASSVINATRELCTASGLPVYRQRTHEGFFRHFLLRVSRTNGQMLAALITAPGSSAAVRNLLRELMRREPRVSGAYWGVSERLADVAYPDVLVHLAGQPMLEDQIGPFRIRLLPFSFLQPSSVQADCIYRQLVEWAGTGQTAWDLYCGLGLIGLYLSSAYERVYGIEVEEDYVTLAREHATINRVSNIEFRAGKAEAALSDKRFWLNEARPDLVVVDPPRVGLHPGVIATLLGARPERIAYLSCNVASLVRDLKAIFAGYPRYRVTHAKAFDMFPQTPHVETLVVLEKT